MAYTPKIFGIVSNSGLTGFTGAIVGTFTLSADGESKVLRGNPSSTISDVRAIANASVLTVDIIGFTALVEPDTLIGDELTVTITSEDTVAITSWTGTVTAAKITGSYDNWWTASITMSKQPTS